MEECECRKRVREPSEKKALKARVNRLIGQMNGIGKMIEDDRYCGDILTQLAAIEKSVKSLSAVVLKSHMRSCLVHDVLNGNLEGIDEIVELFQRF